MFVGVSPVWGVVEGFGFAPETEALISRMSVSPSTARREAINTLINELKAAEVWAERDVIQVYAAHDRQAALLNWKGNTANATEVNSPTFTTDRGYNGNGTTSYVDTNFNPVAFAGLYSVNSANVSVWSLSPEIISTSSFGWFDGLDGTTILFRNTGDTTGMRINQAASKFTGLGSSTDGSGLFSVNRSGASATSMFRNGTQILTETDASVGLNNASFRAGSITATSFSAAQMGYVACGGSLTAGKIMAEYNAVRKFMTALGVA